MAVRIVTDSTCDLPPEIVKELNITVIPQYVVFNNKAYRDLTDLKPDEFYHKLLQEKLFPSTSQPTPQDFVDVYNAVPREGDSILSIHLSAKLSGTMNSAEQAKKMVNGKSPIEIIDSLAVSMALGLTVLAAAKMAKAGKSLAEITAEVKKMIVNTRLLILFDTLEYLAKGGRIGKAKSLLGSILNVKPIIALKDGELVPSGQVRNRAKGKDRLLEFANGFKDVEDMAVIYSTTPDEAKELANGVTSFPKARVQVTRVGPVLATHAGPGVLGIALRTKS
jgi:DegV family protein with EDD domain